MDLAVFGIVDKAHAVFGAVSVVAEMIAVRRDPGSDWRAVAKSIFAHEPLKVLLK